jgi:hypothetical protein
MLHGNQDFPFELLSLMTEQELGAYFETLLDPSSHGHTVNQNPTLKHYSKQHLQEQR